MGVRAGVGAAVLFLAVSVSAEVPSITCKAEGRMFRCTAANAGDYLPEWTLLAKRGYKSFGEEFYFNAPPRWSLIVARIVAADEAGEYVTYRLSVWVRNLKGRAKFAKFDPIHPQGPQ